ncbi:choice-of-anchor L domain-containing protein [Halapricum desulfuricans]|nr:choice-of-anchor L domain-containing protein [Halapricum desulfuricans]
MTDESFELSRRKVLGSMGMMGVAGAAAGLGTSAYFSDEERFTNNALAAGELDMKAAYSAHYSDWSSDEGEGVEINMWDGEPGTTGTAGDLESGYTGLPLNDRWLIEVDDPERFLENTQYLPDEGDRVGNASCDGGTDADQLQQPVIELEDLKPGDFGEVTFDFALCDNPGYVWLTGELLSCAENGITEPEADDPDENEDEPRPPESDADQSSLWPLAALAGVPALGGGGDGGSAEATVEPAENESGGRQSALRKGAAAAGMGAAGLAASSGVASAQANGLSIDRLDNTSGLSAEDLSESLIAGEGGVDIVSGSVEFTGDERGAGAFEGGSDVIGIEDGIVLSSGLADDAEAADGDAPNEDPGTTTDLGTPGDSDLDDLAGGETFNATILEFDFTVPEDADQVFFNYVFGSEEYNEYVGSEFNDVFGFFVNGENVAEVNDPDGAGTIPAAINNINEGNGGTEPTNPDLYINNDPFNPNFDGDTVASGDLAETEMDGFTVVLDVESDVNPGGENSIKLAIADTSDAILDSWVFIQGESLSTEDPDEPEEPEPAQCPDVELLDVVQVAAWVDDGNNYQNGDEQPAFVGSLREVLDELTSGSGLGLVGDLDAEAAGGTGRNCFSAGTTHSVGFAWWVPVDHGNEIQTDSAMFDLGFYTEQCRHNDGAGMPPETTPNGNETNGNTTNGNVSNQSAD